MFKLLLASALFVLSSPSIVSLDNTDIKCEHIEEHCECFCENDNLNQPRMSYTYKDNCWYCGSAINSNYNTRCKKCGWYICKSCGRCEYTCERWYKGSSKSSSSSSDGTSWIWYVLGIALLVVGGYGIYYYFKD